MLSLTHPICLGLHTFRSIPLPLWEACRLFILRPHPRSATPAGIMATNLSSASQFRLPLHTCPIL